MLVKCNDMGVKEEYKKSPDKNCINSVDVKNDVSEAIVEKLLHPDELGIIVQGSSKHFYSSGAFNLIQLILYVIKQTGPAHLFLTTYSISMESINTLKRKYDSGEILSVKYLIDNRVRSISPKPFDYLITSFKGCYKCCALHAKVALIYNDKWKVTIVGSQNATNNPKLERGIIHTDHSVFNFDIKMLENEFDRGTT